MTPEDITWVVSTHGHSDHLGNNNLFLKAKHIVGTNISQRNRYFIHDFNSGKSAQSSRMNVMEIWFRYIHLLSTVPPGPEVGGRFGSSSRLVCHSDKIDTRYGMRYRLCLEYVGNATMMLGKFNKKSNLMERDSDWCRSGCVNKVVETESVSMTRIILLKVRTGNEFTEAETVRNLISNLNK